MEENKIGLTEEELDLCCTLLTPTPTSISEYEYRKSPFVDITGLYRKGYYSEVISDRASPLYRDFIQLVIEQIQRKEFAYFRYDYYIRYDYSDRLIQIFSNSHYDLTSYIATVSYSTSITEGKEKVIKYVLETMEI